MAVKKYTNYIKGKGPGLIQKGKIIDTSQDQPKANKRTKTEIIRDLILQRVRISKIVLQFPQLIEKIYKLARLRPQRQFRTDVVYYYGPSGMGKTNSIDTLLRTIRHIYPEVDYYSKMGGLSKFWDGYDNQPIVWIDDSYSLQ